MAGFNTVVLAVWGAWLSAAARSGLKGLPLEWIALMLRLTLPVAPQLSDTLLALQASGHWHLFMPMVA